ncbi:MAG: hypothetical protein QNJ47_18605 [Nostocaceae cyanobacterium]|nr:hypothetical protein [Nostocaceae cyanobacterium]
MFNKLAFSLCFIMMIWLCLPEYSALSQQFDSRIINLEFDINRLESRINQIELQLSQTRRLPSSRNRNNTPSSSPRRRRMSQTERDKMFDRLATLVIELKQDIRSLEKRVTQLESK